MIDASEARTLLREMFFIVIAAAFLGYCIAMFHPKGYVLIGRGALNDTRIVTISVDEARPKRNCSALFIDARGRLDYNVSHIAGAVSIPASPESVTLHAIREHFKKIGDAGELVVYCGGSSCGISTQVAKRLISMGYSRHIYVLAEGFAGWREKRLPLEAGEEHDGE